MEDKFLKDYFSKLKSLINFDEDTIQKLLNVKQILLSAKKNNKKGIIFGNGGSAAIASHFSVDITKIAQYLKILTYL